MSKILLIGSRQNKYNPTDTGGVTVLFELLIKELKEKKIDFDVIDTLKENYRNTIVAYITIIFKLIINIHKYSHVSLQATANSFIAIGPIIIFMAKLFNKKISIRKFAGNFNEIHSNSKGIKRYLIEYVLKNSDIIFFETKYLVEYFKKFNEKTYWFPNVRQKKVIPSLPRKYKKRFVFMGTINPEKGIDEICEAIQHIGNEYTIDIYGPICNIKYSNKYFKEINVSYQGALKAEEVISILNQYDVLILPSYVEGYPGVIIEAFSLGIPVIATKLTGIMEMVKDGKNGLLIDIKNSLQLTKAIESIDSNNYAKLSEKSLKSFDNFNSNTQTDKFLKYIGVSNN